MHPFFHALDSLNCYEHGTVHTIATDGTFIVDDTVIAPETIYAFNGGTDWDDLPDNWTPVTNRSNQHGYSGPIFHPSEVPSEDMLASILADAGVSLDVVVVSVEDSDDLDSPHGWAILTRPHND